MPTEKKRKAKLRAINNGTRYDIVGSLKRLARQIERGEKGDIRDIVLGVREVRPSGAVAVECYHWGTGDIATAVYTLDAARGKML